MCGVSVDPHLRLSGRVADPFPLRRMVSRGVLLWLGVLNPVAWRGFGGFGACVGS